MRILKPRFKMHTGHITIGGSICADFLTMHKWDPSLSVETVLRSVLNLMLEGRAEIDIYNRYPTYSLSEAQDAYQRFFGFTIGVRTVWGVNVNILDGLSMLQGCLE